MQFKTEIIERGGLLAKTHKNVRISDVKTTDEQLLFNAIRKLFYHHGQKSRITLYVKMPGYSGAVGDFQSPEDANHFLCGYVLAMKMKGLEIDWSDTADPGDTFS